VKGGRGEGATPASLHPLPRSVPVYVSLYYALRELNNDPVATGE